MGGVSDVARHVALLQSSYRHWTGKTLFDPGLTDHAAVAWLERAGFALVSHDTQADPVFNYANATALELFGMSWDEFTALHSRYSAEAMEREERASLLAQVARNGYIDAYAGVRIAKSGARFRVRNATVWNLLDESGAYYGQAAMLPEWEYCS